MQYEIDGRRVLEILKENSVADAQLALHIQSASWQAIAERLKEKIENPQQMVDPNPQPELEPKE